MSGRQVQIEVVCEDSQHEAFVRRVLAGLGHDRNKLRVTKSPHGRGAADAWVLAQIPRLLREYRARHRAYFIVVMMDADRVSAKERLRQLDEICQDQGVEPRRPDERVAVLLPKRNIETWLAYLDGATVDEHSAYPKLPFASGCQPQVSALLEGCRKNQLREPVPPSLTQACSEYRARIRA